MSRDDIAPTEDITWRYDVSGVLYNRVFIVKVTEPPTAVSFRSVLTLEVQSDYPNPNPEGHSIFPPRQCKASKDDVEPECCLDRFREKASGP